MGFALFLLATEAMATGGVTVTGQRHQQAQAEAPKSAEFTDRKAVDDGGHLDLSELFATMPGVSLREVAPGAISPVIRGLMGADNLVLVDGLRYNTSLFRPGAGREVNSLGLYSFESVELIRGSGGSSYGEGALGGVLSLTTRDLEQPDPRWWYWREFFAYPGNTRYNFTSLLKKQGKRWSGALAVQRDKFRGRNHGGLYQGLATEIPKADHGQWDWMGKLLYKTGAWRWTLATIGMSVKGGGELDQLPRGELRRVAPGDQFAWLKGQGRHRGLLRRSELWIGSRYAQRTERIDRCAGGGSSALDAAACLERFDLAIGDEGFARDGLVARVEDRERVLMHQAGLRLRSKRMAGWRISTGADLALEEVSSQRHDLLADSAALAPAFGDGLGAVTAGVFAQIEGLLGQVGARELSLRSGLRFGAYAVTDAMEDRQRLFAMPSGDISLNLRRRGRSAAWLALSRSGRAPNLHELFYEGDTGAFYQLPGQTLEPQKATTVELGSKQRNADLSYQASLFAMRIDGLLEARRAAADSSIRKPVVQLHNVDRGHFYGGDLGLTHRMAPQWTQSHQLGVVLGEVVDGDVVQISRRSVPLQGRHAISHRWAKRWRGEVNLAWAAPVGAAGIAPIDAIDLRVCPSAQQPWLSSGEAGEGCDGTPGWWTAGLRTVWQRSKSTRLGLRIDNLFDRRYRLHQSATEAKGVTVRLDVEVGF